MGQERESARGAEKSSVDPPACRARRIQDAREGRAGDGGDRGRAEQEARERGIDPRGEKGGDRGAGGGRSGRNKRGRGEDDRGRREGERRKERRYGRAMYREMTTGVWQSGGRGRGREGGILRSDRTAGDRNWQELATGRGIGVAMASARRSRARGRGAGVRGGRRAAEGRVPEVPSDLFCGHEHAGNVERSGSEFAGAVTAPRKKRIDRYDRTINRVSREGERKSEEGEMRRSDCYLGHERLARKTVLSTYFFLSRLRARAAVRRLSGMRRVSASVREDSGILYITFASVPVASQEDAQETVASGRDVCSNLKHSRLGKLGSPRPRDVEIRQRIARGGNN